MKGWGELHRALIKIRWEYDLTIPETLQIINRAEKNYKNKLLDKNGKLNYQIEEKYLFKLISVIIYKLAKFRL